MTLCTTWHDLFLHKRFFIHLLCLFKTNFAFYVQAVNVHYSDETWWKLWKLYSVQNQDFQFPPSLHFIFFIPEGDLDAGFYEGILDYNILLHLLTHRGSLTWQQWEQERNRIFFLAVYVQWTLYERVLEGRLNARLSNSSICWGHQSVCFLRASQCACYDFWTSMVYFWHCK